MTVDETEISEYVLRLPYLDGARDAHRNLVDSWAAPEPVGIIALDPGASQESRRPDHDQVITTPTMYAPYGTPFTHRDLCVARSGVYEVEGTPRQWIDEYGAPVGDVVKLRKVDG